MREHEKKGDVGKGAHETNKTHYHVTHHENLTIETDRADNTHNKRGMETCMR
jgi:hypothetical protein